MKQSCAPLSAVDTVSVHSTAQLVSGTDKSRERLNQAPLNDALCIIHILAGQVAAIDWPNLELEALLRTPAPRSIQSLLGERARTPKGLNAVNQLRRRRPKSGPDGGDHSRQVQLAAATAAPEVVKSSPSRYLSTSAHKANNRGFACQFVLLSPIRWH